MPQTSREIVTRCLKFETPERMPRQMGYLPGSANQFPEVIKQINESYPSDLAGPAGVYRPSPRVQGDPYSIGVSVDDWGCAIVNIQAGVIGEVRDPILKDIADWQKIEPPYETLPEDWGKARDIVNRSCAESDKFMFCGCCPRPWERMQFLRGTANAMMDVMMPDQGGAGLIRKIHDYHMKELEFWASTDVDSLLFMDDWGSQQQLLIPPAIWRELFKPLYKDYCDLAHANGKFAFMHSDGCISAIYEDLVEVGVDAQNSQLFVMDMEDLARRVKGRITFWGELDRQHIMPSRDPEAVRAAVRKVARHFYDPRGGIIAQFEFGPADNPANPGIIFEEWDAIQAEARAATGGA